MSFLKELNFIFALECSLEVADIGYRDKSVKN